MSNAFSIGVRNQLVKCWSNCHIFVLKDPPLPTNYVEKFPTCFSEYILLNHALDKCLIPFEHIRIFLLYYCLPDTFANIINSMLNGTWKANQLEAIQKLPTKNTCRSDKKGRLFRHVMYRTLQSVLRPSLPFVPLDMLRCYINWNGG